MGFVDPAAPLLATCGGDTVKLFDVSVESGDPCVLAYTPVPAHPVNAVKWNHTNLIVASAGDDKKISLWHKKGQNIGQLPTSTVDRGDDIEECIYSISFSNKGSRYLCSGGSGHIVRIWDLQRKRCIKWLSGHTDTITGVMYNCKDEHLASISMKGDLILHNLASGARAAELSDPNGQVLRVLDYSRNSRHLLVTAGDDGSVHLWDTTARSPKVSWLKQHSAPTSGVCISPSSDKIIATVGLDKKLYTLDSGSRRPTHTIPHEAPFSSLAYNDDGTILAAGTNSGRVVFYDVRGRPQPLTILRAYNSSEAVTGLCWQRSKPVIVKENSSSEVALLGGTSEESVLMPDPLPSATTTTSGVVVPSLRSSLTANTSGFLSTSNSSTTEETPYRTRLLSGGPLSKLQAPRGNYNLKDDMDVFSPLVDVQPFTPSSGSWWDEHGSDDTKKEDKPGEKRLSTTRKFPYIEGNDEPHPISDWRSVANSRQDGTSSMTTTSMPSWKSEPSISSPEASTGNALPDRLTQRQQISRFGASAFPTGGFSFAGLQDSASTPNHSLKGSVTSNILMNLQNKGILSNAHSSLDTSSASLQSSLPSSYASKTVSSVNSDLSGAVQSTSMWRPSTYTDRMSSSSVFSEGLASAFGSPKSKKAGAETKDELLSSLLSRQEAATASSSASLLASNGLVPPQLPNSGSSTDQQGASSFSLQYVQRMLEESLGSVQKSIHEDVRNLHIEVLRQFHMQEMEMSGVLNLVLDKLEGLTKEVQQLRRENQQLRHQLL
ncbi:protein NEDD1 [Phragmites australis]|uniref:protein NEDD1 n=1 Tax=Phragmites australis TaxID=29695 RepID=UPI002D787D14|nr:protein NEDD1 [Phragmites australis]